MAQLSGEAFGKSWGTHHPVLAAVLAVAPPGPVLELGAGWFSTPLLHTMCAAMKRRLVTIDSDPAWLQTFECLRGPGHALMMALPSWRALEPAMDAEPLWSVVLVDHAPAERRAVDLIRLADRVEHFVVHDTNYGGYGYEHVLPKFKHRYDYTLMEPRTTVVSNRRPFSL